MESIRTGVPTPEMLEKEIEVEERSLHAFGGINTITDQLIAQDGAEIVGCGFQNTGIPNTLTAENCRHALPSEPPPRPPEISPISPIYIN